MKRLGIRYLRRGRIGMYNDVLAVLQEDNVEENRRVGPIEMFDQFITFLNRYM